MKGIFRGESQVAEALHITSKVCDDKYVAVEDFGSVEVLAYGNNPAEVAENVRVLGINDPVIFFNPKHDATCVY